mgnify:CR=1 FL=1
MMTVKNDVKSKNDDGRRETLPVALSAKLKQMLSSRSQAEIATLMDVSVPTVQRMVSGNSPVTVGKLLRLAEGLGVPLEEVFDLEGSAPTPEGGIPIHDVSFSAGGGAEIILAGESDQKAMFPLSWLRQQFGKIDNLRMVRVAGDSMHPTIADGEWVIIDLDRTSGPGIFALRLQDQVYIKRLQFQPSRVLAISDNPSHEVFVINLKDKADRDGFQVIGRVVWTGKML